MLNTASAVHEKYPRELALKGVVPDRFCRTKPLSLFCALGGRVFLTFSDALHGCKCAKLFGLH
jgi:hypothetical protein